MVGRSGFADGGVFMTGRLGLVALAVIVVAVAAAASITTTKIWGLHSFDSSLHSSSIASAADDGAEAGGDGGPDDEATDEAPVAMVIAAEGAVSVIRDQGTPDERVMSPAKPGLLLFRGDQIWTGEDGWLELQFEEFARVLIAPNSRVEVVSGLVRELDKETQRLLPTLRLLLGRVYAHVAGALSRMRNFSVETPSAIAGVRGTIFAVEAGVTGKTLVSVRRGVVAVASLSLPRNESLVGAGEEIEVFPGEAPPAPRALGAAEAERWERVNDWFARQMEWRDSLRLQGRADLADRLRRFWDWTFDSEQQRGNEPGANSGVPVRTGASRGLIPPAADPFLVPAPPKWISGGVFRRHRNS